MHLDGKADTSLAMAQNLNTPSEFRLYGRSVGKALSARQQKLIDELLPRLDLPLTGSIDPNDFNTDRRSQVLEIGFGGGEHLAGQALRNPDSGFIGIEPFLNGVAKALTHVEEGNLDNVRIHRGDARETLQQMTDQSFDHIYLMFPDPWPKVRHTKRRFVQAATRDHFARLLKPGGRLRIATDVKIYIDHVMTQMVHDTRFEWTSKRASDWRQPPDDHVQTRYESKNLGDCKPVWMDFIRI
jgi:tRNA (guanine-N7-)-methyltransferase